MMTEDLNAPTGEQPNMPAETIATEMPSRTPDDVTSEQEVVASAEAEQPEDEQPEDEQPEAGESEQPAGEQPQKPEQKLDWKDKRRIEETNKRRAAEAERDRYKAELEAVKNGGTRPAAPNDPAQTPEQIRAAAVEEARREIVAEQQQKDFADATGRVLQAGLAAHTDFDQARTEMVHNFGDQLAQRNDFFEAIINLENGHDVFYALAKDPEQAEQVLAMPPVKMAVKLTQLSASLGSKQPDAKPISKAPAPVKPVAGVPQSSSRLDDEAVPMDQWANTYLKQMAGKR